MSSTACASVSSSFSPSPCTEAAAHEPSPCTEASPDEPSPSSDQAPEDAVHTAGLAPALGPLLLVPLLGTLDRLTPLLAPLPPLQTPLLMPARPLTSLRGDRDGVLAPEVASALKFVTT